MVSPAMCKKTIEIRAGELVSLAGLVTVELLHKTGRTARLQITAPREVSVEKRSSSNGSSHAEVRRNNPS